LPPASAADVEAAEMDLMALVGRFCGGSARWAVLDRQNPRLAL